MQVLPEPLRAQWGIGQEEAVADATAEAENEVSQEESHMHLRDFHLNQHQLQDLSAQIWKPQKQRAWTIPIITETPTLPDLAD